MSDNRSKNTETGSAIGGGAGAAAGAAAAAVIAPGVVGSIVVASVASKVGSDLGGSLVRNFKDGNDGLKTKADGSVFSFGDGYQVAPVNATAFIGKGAAVGASVSAVEHRNDKGDSFNVAKVGANCGVSNRGVNVGVEAKPIWAEGKYGNKTIGYGLNADTGFKANGDEVSASFLGFGFKAGNNGTGIKTPFFNISW